MQKAARIRFREHGSLISLLRYSATPRTSPCLSTSFHLPGHEEQCYHIQPPARLHSTFWRAAKKTSCFKLNGGPSFTLIRHCFYFPSSLKCNMGCRRELHIHCSKMRYRRRNIPSPPDREVRRGVRERVQNVTQPTVFFECTTEPCERKKNDEKRTRRTQEVAGGNIGTRQIIDPTEERQEYLRSQSGIPSRGAVVIVNHYGSGEGGSGAFLWLFMRNKRIWRYWNITCSQGTSMSREGMFVRV